MKAKLIKEKDWYDLYRIDEDGKRVTFASTQDYKQKLSLKNCQAIECGYDLDELAYEITSKEHLLATQYSKGYEKGIVIGFQKALEILGDRKFTERDLDKAIEWGINSGRLGDVTHYDIDEFIQSLQQNEWEVDIIIECTQCQSYGYVSECRDNCNKKFLQPKLDADGCLKLKRV